MQGLLLTIMLWSSAPDDTKRPLDNGLRLIESTIDEHPCLGVSLNRLTFMDASGGVAEYWTNAPHIVGAVYQLEGEAEGIIEFIPNIPGRISESVDEIHIDDFMACGMLTENQRGVASTTATLVGNVFD